MRISSDPEVASAKSRKARNPSAETVSLSSDSATLVSKGDSEPGGSVLGGVLKSLGSYLAGSLDLGTTATKSLEAQRRQARSGMKKRNITGLTDSDQQPEYIRCIEELDKEGRITIEGDVYFRHGFSQDTGVHKIWLSRADLGEGPLRSFQPEDEELISPPGWRTTKVYQV